MMHDIPKTAFEMTAFTDICSSKMLKAYKMLKKKLNLSVQPIDPLDFVHRFGSRLNLEPAIISMASQIITKIKNTHIFGGKQPKTIVASALYLASQMNDDYRTQREFANATGVLEVTLRLRSKELSKFF